MRALRGLCTFAAVIAAISMGPSCSCDDEFGSNFTAGVGGAASSAATTEAGPTTTGTPTTTSTTSTSTSGDGGGGGGGEGPGTGGQGPGSGGQGPGSGGQGPGSGGQGPGGQGGGGAAPAECANPGDCDALFAPPACGVWTCNGGFCEASSPSCVDDDHDGFGFGASCACAGLDCDDTDEAIGSSDVRGCYSGTPGTDQNGTCSAGTETCTAGAWSPCVGEIVPSGEACNGQDDDCNGTDDDNLGTIPCGLGACLTNIPSCSGGVVATCVPTSLGVPDICNGIDDDCDGPIDEDCATCVPVAPVAAGGNDAVVTPTFAAPFATIQRAIDWTVANGGPTVVCVSAGATCGTTATYTNAANATITMADGISVIGNYARTAGTWTHCAPSSGTTTILQPQTAQGVLFPATVTSPTALDGFRVDRFTAATTAAITVDGATGVILSHVFVTNTPAVDNSYGVRLLNGGSALITQSKIDAGDGGNNGGASVGIQAIGSQVTVTNNCLSLNAQGRCDDGCGSNVSIRGNTVAGPGVSYAIELDDSPGSIVESSALCNAQGDVSAMIHIVGDATGTVVRANNIAQFGGTAESYGVWMEDCADAAPWIVDNHRIIAGGETNATVVDAVRAIGACHPVIDSNVQITGGGEGNASATTGVHCGANTSGVASQCVVLNNPRIEGSQFGFPPGATGVRCDLDGCARIANNVITGHGGNVSRGISLEQTTAVVEDNVIRGGCSGTSTGIFADDTAARIHNNFISGYSSGDCTSGSGTLATSTGLDVRVAAGLREIDVHSNTIDGTGSPNACVSRAVAWGVAAAAPTVGVGILRNNILLAGSCITARHGFAELAAAADPRIFENNDLDPAGVPTAIYLDETFTALTTEIQVNALLDMTVGGVISAAAGFVAYPTDLHLAAGSPCDGTGTPSGAPGSDFDGDIRDPATPDIGADER